MASVPECGASSSVPKIQTFPGVGTTPANSRSERNPPLVGSGLGAIVQLLPSQCKSNVIWCPDPSDAKYDPNAQMSLDNFAFNQKKRFVGKSFPGPTFGPGTPSHFVRQRFWIGGGVA